MIDIPTIAFIGLPLLTGCIGIGLGVWWQLANNSEGYWKDIAERKAEAISYYHRQMAKAAKELNDQEEELREALASNRRLTDALQCKNERLERIVEAFADQRSGTAKKAVKLAIGDA